MPPTDSSGPPSIVMHDHEGISQVLSIYPLSLHSFSFIIGPFSAPIQLTISREKNPDWVMQQVHLAAVILASNTVDVVAGCDSGEPFPLIDTDGRRYYLAIHRLSESFSIFLRSSHSEYVTTLPIITNLSHSLLNIHRLSLLSEIFYLPEQAGTI